MKCVVDFGSTDFGCAVFCFCSLIRILMAQLMQNIEKTFGFGIINFYAPQTGEHIAAAIRGINLKLHWYIVFDEGRCSVQEP